MLQNFGRPLIYSVSVCIFEPEPEIEPEPVILEHKIFVYIRS